MERLEGAGNVTGFHDSVLGEWDFTDDWLNRLASATGVSGGFNGITVATASQGWTYDSFGNRVGQTQGSLQTPTHWAGYDPSTNQTLTSDLAPGGVSGGVSTDADGRILNDGSKSYIWEAQGWLCGVTASTGSHYQYIYGAEGNLVTTASRANAGCDLSVTTLSDFVIGQSGQKVSEATAAHAWKSTNVYANGQLFATYDGTGLHFALNDWLGTKRIQTSPISTVELTCWNLPFNDGYGCSGTARTPPTCTTPARSMTLTPHSISSAQETIPTIRADSCHLIPLILAWISICRRPGIDTTMLSTIP